MNSFLIIGVVQAMFLALLVISKPQKSRADYLLVGWFLVSAAHIGFFYISLNHWFASHKTLLIAGTGMPFLQGVILYFYVSELINQRLHWLKCVLHLSPFVAYILSFSIYNHYHPQAFGVVDGTLRMHEHLPWLMWNHGVFKAILGTSYVMWSLFILVRYQLDLPHHYSSHDKINLNWLKYWLISTLGLTFVIVAIIVIGADMQFMSISNTYRLVGGLFILLIFVMGFFGFRQTTIFVEKNLPNSQPVLDKEIQYTKNENNKAPKYQKSGLGSEQAARYRDQLLEYMEQHQPYLESKLTLSQLASQLDISTHHLSQIINEQLDKNFFDFVNHYRVTTVKQKLQDSAFAHYTLLGIALESGFNSKTSFNTVFKKMTGMTPSQYQKSLEK